jgi:hypothetical protein
MTAAPADRRRVAPAHALLCLLLLVSGSCGGRRSGTAAAAAASASSASASSSLVWDDSGGSSGVVTANVRAFGAVGDGRTDDLAALRLALSNVTAHGGGTIFFPAGQYAVSGALRVTGYGIAFRGTGSHPIAACSWGSAILSMTRNSTMVVFEDCTSCSISHLTLSHIGSATTNIDGAPQSACNAAAAATHVLRPTRPRLGKQPPTVTLPLVPYTSTILPNTGAAVTIRQSFAITLHDLWITRVYAHVAMSEFANTITIRDSQFISAFGPCAICAAGGIGPPVGLTNANFNRTRVDILQITRLTTNNEGDANASVVWIDIGGGVNTVRLDNVGVINGGTGVRMASPADEPAGCYPGRPLFLIANDLEIDFPSGNAIDLMSGEEVQISNGYVQGAGATTIVNRRHESNLGVGILVGPLFNSEIMVVNTRIFGHALAGVELSGGAHTTFTNNVISANSIAKAGASPGIRVRAGVSNFILQGNHIGNVFHGQKTSSTSFGIEVEPGSSNNYVISANTLVGNIRAGLRDGGKGPNKQVTANVV